MVIFDFLKHDPIFSQELGQKRNPCAGSLSGGTPTFFWIGLFYACLGKVHPAELTKFSLPLVYRRLNEKTQARPVELTLVSIGLSYLRF